MKTFIFDVDGTLTDYRGFVEKYAVPFFTKKYGMCVRQPDKLEVEDIFSMDQYFREKWSCSEEEAKQKTKKALNCFWVGLPYVKYTLVWKFRAGTKELFKELRKHGLEIEIHTSRAKTTDNTLVGKIARLLMYLQLWKNGFWVSKKQIHFYEDDDEKISQIIKRQPVCVFEDKAEIVQELEKNKIPIFCVSALYNKEISPSAFVTVLQDFNWGNIKERIRKITGKREFEYFKRATDSNTFFKRLTFFRPFVLWYFKPIILHSENIYEGTKNVLYVSNHRTTLDPLVITGYLKQNIHWAALKRFFEAKDSIFNNSKNPMLCNITAKVFHRLEYFPIERKRDCEEPNNFQAIKDMCYFLKIGESVGIFPEGTTKRQKGKEFGDFDDSFVLLAKNSEAWIQPITVLWITELKIPQKMILNFGKPFQVKRDSSLEEIMQHFISVQENSLRENKELRESLTKRKRR